MVMFPSSPLLITAMTAMPTSAAAPFIPVFRAALSRGVSRWGDDTKRVVGPAAGICLAGGGL